MDAVKYKALMKHFGFKNTLLLRIEHLFLYSVLQRLPTDIRNLKQLWDTAVRQGDRGPGEKVYLDNPRPDWLSYIPVGDGSYHILHLEIDENLHHERSEARIAKIKEQATLDQTKYYVAPHNHHIVIRVMVNGTSANDSMVTRVNGKYGSYYILTPAGEQAVSAVADQMETTCALFKTDGGIHASSHTYYVGHNEPNEYYGKVSRKGSSSSSSWINSSSNSLTLIFLPFLMCLGRSGGRCGS